MFVFLSTDGEQHVSGGVPRCEDGVFRDRRERRVEPAAGVGGGRQLPVRGAQRAGRPVQRLAVPAGQAAAHVLQRAQREHEPAPGVPAEQRQRRGCPAGRHVRQLRQVRGLAAAGAAGAGRAPGAAPDHRHDRQRRGQAGERPDHRAHRPGHPQRGGGLAGQVH